MKENFEKQLKTLITETTAEINANKEKEYSSELDQIFDQSKTEKKKEIYDQALVDLNKSTDLNQFILHGIEKSEKEIDSATKERKEIRASIAIGDTIDQKKNGEVNGSIVAYNTLLQVCLDNSSESARADYKARTTNQ